MDTFLAAAAALAAPVGVSFLFTLAIRSLINADRTERAALARMDAEERARREADAARPEGASASSPVHGPAGRPGPDPV